MTPPTPAARGSEPTGAELLELERCSRARGSGLSAAALTGVWRLDQLWGKQDANPQASAAALLRGLQATLAIEAGPSCTLQLRNSVQLGPLQLRFLGPGELRGRRPLLVFRFSCWQLTWGQRLLAGGTLAAAAARREPFFALIACGPSASGAAPGQWLAARGRGGGLALWRRAASPG